MADLTSDPVESLCPSWDLDFWWLDWPLMQQGVSLRVWGGWDMVMKKGVGVVGSE